MLDTIHLLVTIHHTHIMNRFLAPSFAFLLAAAILYLWLSPSGIQKAPTLKLSSMQQQSFHIGANQDKPSLVVFWATSCVGCVKKIPDMIALQNDMGEDINIIAIAMQDDPVEHIIKMRASKNINYPIVLDTTGNYAQQFGEVRLTPTTLLINSDGRIIFQRIGNINFDSLRQRIQTLL